MATKLDQLFAQKNKRVLNVYCTAGYPALHSLPEVLQALQTHGADIIEIGLPYSDPLADGPVIQASSARALENGITIREVFSQLAGCRSSIHVPLILMGYMNPVLQYGFDRFCAEAKSLGIDGLILPDLPIYEFESEYGNIIRKNGLDFIFLITPETTETRIRKLDALSTGFLYAVSSSSTTGSTSDPAPRSAYFERLAKMNLNNPVLVGFGIKDRRSFDQASALLNGAIIGSAYIQAIANTNDIDKTTREFIHGIIS